MRDREETDICAFCDEFNLRAATLADADQGRAPCQKRVDNGRYPVVLVAWNELPCVSFRLERRQIGVRRDFVEKLCARSKTCCASIDLTQ